MGVRILLGCCVAGWLWTAAPFCGSAAPDRAPLARAIVNRPSIILADEPTGNLDLHTGEEIIGLLSDMKEKLGITIITATHDTKMLSASDRVVWIKDGAVDRVANRSEVQIDIGTIDGKTLA